MTTIYDMNPTDEELKLLFDTPPKSVEEYKDRVDYMEAGCDRVRLYEIRGEYDRAENLMEILEFISEYDEKLSIRTYKLPLP